MGDVVRRMEKGQGSCTRDLPVNSPQAKISFPSKIFSFPVTQIEKSSIYYIFRTRNSTFRYTDYDPFRYADYEPTA